MHIPVMPDESLALLAVKPNGTYYDATAGFGGHTSLIARQLESGIAIANDRDAESLAAAQRNTAEWQDRIRYHQGPFSGIGEAVAEAGLEKLDGILADLGVSFYQLTHPPR